MAGELEPREQDDIVGLLRQLDHPLPAVSVDDIMNRARKPGRRWRLAASLFLPLAVAGAAYALPGSPLPRWIDTLNARLTSSPAPAPNEPASPPKRETQAGPGIAVSPGRTLVILFTHAQASGEARVSLVDDTDLTVQSSTGGPGFTSDSDRLVIRNPGSTASFEILIPRHANRVEIRIAATRVFLKQGDQVHTSGNEADGTWRILLGETRP